MTTNRAAISELPSNPALRRNADVVKGEDDGGVEGHGQQNVQVLLDGPLRVGPGQQRPGQVDGHVHGGEQHSGREGQQRGRQDALPAQTDGQPRRQRAAQDAQDRDQVGMEELAQDLAAGGDRDDLGDPENFALAREGRRGGAVQTAAGDEECGGEQDLGRALSRAQESSGWPAKTNRRRCAP